MRPVSIPSYLFSLTKKKLHTKVREDPSNVTLVYDELTKPFEIISDDNYLSTQRSMRYFFKRNKILCMKIKSSKLCFQTLSSSSLIPQRAESEKEYLYSVYIDSFILIHTYLS
mmetsp:Transcript_7/g.10  ORF Transcript_7/g.10 Transcript_7/m.10 type:complete len:113 (-) Transcript_7:689-1027(-)